MAGAGAGVCRACLAPARAREGPALRALRAATGLQCAYDDGLPQFICETCQQLLKAFMLFKFQCETADQWMRQHYKTSLENVTETSSKLQFAPIIKLESLPTTAELKLEAELKLAEFYKDNVTYVPEILCVNSSDRKKAGKNATEESQLPDATLAEEQEKSPETHPKDDDHTNPTQTSNTGEFYVEFEMERSDLLNNDNLMEDRPVIESKPIIKCSNIVQPQEASEVSGDTSSNLLKTTTKLEFSASESLEEHEKESETPAIEHYDAPPKAIKRQLTITPDITCHSPPKAMKRQLTIAPNITCVQSMIVIDCMQPRTEINENKKLKPDNSQSRNVLHFKRDLSDRSPNTSGASAAYNIFKLKGNTKTATHKNDYLERFSDTRQSMLARYLAWRRLLDPGTSAKYSRVSSTRADQKRSKVVNDNKRGTVVLRNKYTERKKSIPPKILSKSKNETPVEREIYSSFADSSIEFRQRAMALAVGPVNKKSTQLECRLCKVVFKNFRTFENHAHSHFGYKHLCEFCGKGFPCRGPLRKHLQSLHGFERDWPCTYCDAKFVYRDRLKIHEMRFHTNERPFICDQCGSSYCSKPILTQHIRLSHQEGRPYKCDECSRTFKLSASRNYHKKITHHPTYKFLCHICNSTFTKVRHARKHFLRIHKIPKEQQVAKVHRWYFEKSQSSEVEKTAAEQKPDEALVC